MYDTTCPTKRYRYCELFSSVSWHCCKQALHTVINRFPDLSLEEKSLKPLLAKAVKNAYAPEQGIRKVPLKMPILLLKMAQRYKKVVIGTKSASKMPFLGLRKCPSTVKKKCPFKTKSAPLKPGPPCPLDLPAPLDIPKYYVQFCLLVQIDLESTHSCVYWSR